MTKPMFSIHDNGDGSATIYDGGLAVSTIRRDRGTYETGRKSGNDYVGLKYVAQGHELRNAGGSRLDGPTLHISVASSSVEVSEGVNADTVNEAIAAARPLYVAGRVADLRDWHRRGQFDAENQAQLAEWIPKYRKNGEDDLADAFAEFLEEIR